uniref:Uncharacterized protein n=1 Tax=Melanopsichium pennsylvanicum 4 TaxID=1398559 RepID=A0A077QXL3_9BASI|nr:uncharacterized protein BN887_06019 [Melanopsichium pennsylvanicum 4]
MALRWCLDGELVVMDVQESDDDDARMQTFKRQGMSTVVQVPISMEVMEHVV